MEGKAEVYCLLSLNDPGIVRGRQAIAPIYSELFLRALDRRKLASDVASHALSDTFCIAMRVLGYENSGHHCRSPLPRAPFRQMLFYQFGYPMRHRHKRRPLLGI